MTLEPSRLNLPKFNYLRSMPLFFAFVYHVIVTVPLVLNILKNMSLSLHMCFCVIFRSLVKFLVQRGNSVVADS